MIQLNNCGVEFFDSTHEYILNGRKLKGITGLLHRCLFPDMYKGVSDEVLKQAAQEGSVVHEQIELYDTLGLEPSTPEAKAYARMKQELGYETVANEYIVSNGEDYASGIDLTMHKVGGAENEVELWDIKHTYNVNRSYVEWQLSIYKDFFEAINPDVKVAAIKCLWLRNDKKRGLIKKLIPLKPHSKAEVARLLECDRNGIQYDVEAEKEAPYIVECEQRLVWLTKQIDELSAEKKELTAKILQGMQQDGSEKVSTPFLTISRTKPSSVTTLDIKSLDADDEKLYEQLVEKYPKVTTKAEGIRIILKKGNE